mgnify:CR=1 FL=1|jgi:hypothetical protein
MQLPNTQRLYRHLKKLSRALLLSSLEQMHDIIMARIGTPKVIPMIIPPILLSPTQKAGAPMCAAGVSFCFINFVF